MITRKENKFKHKYVMLIDDDELDNFINEKMVQASCFSENTYITTSGKSALEFLSNIVNNFPNPEIVFPEVIFIDINMPIMDGFQFIQLLKSTFSNHLKYTQLIILTSSVFPEDKERAYELSSNILFMNKPLTEEMLNNFDIPTKIIQ